MYGYVPQGARVLDVGCSTGNFGEALEALKHCVVVGIDVSEADVLEARTKITEAYVLDITGDGVADKLGTFDVVVFADVLEHLVDPRAALRAVHSLLNPSGIVVYSIPHMGHLSVRMDLLEGRFPYTELGLLDRTHLHYYDRVEVHDIFAAAGFGIVDENPILADYPARWTTERLSAIGLVPTEPFFDMLRQTEAHIYQFVGTAVPQSEAPASPSRASKETTPPEEVLAYANRIVAKNEALQNELDVLHSRIAAVRRNPLLGVVRELRRRMLRRRS